MKLVYGISRWTNPARASARHIDDGNGKPLCGDKRKVFSWQREEGQPTCQKCISKRLNNKEGEVKMTDKLVEKCLLTDEELDALPQPIESDISDKWEYERWFLRYQLIHAIPIIAKAEAEKCTVAFNTGLDMGKKAVAEEIKRELEKHYREGGLELLSRWQGVVINAKSWHTFWERYLVANK